MTDNKSKMELEILCMTRNAQCGVTDSALEAQILGALKPMKIKLIVFHCNCYWIGLEKKTPGVAKFEPRAAKDSFALP